MKVLIVFHILLLGLSLASKTRFDNYRVYRVDIDHEDQLAALQSLEQRGYDFWKNGRLGQHSDVMVAPDKIEEFENLIGNMNSSIKIDNVQSLIDSQKISPRQQTGISWTAYYTYTEIYAWLDSLLLEFPGVLTNHLVGNSFEGRPIRAIRLSKRAGNPVIFLESNIHAREWISSATATWLLNELLRSTDPKIVSMSTNYDWIIVPILNVDGFVYTHEKNRMWRKTRQPHSLFCQGADPNRNFDFHWLYNGEGASKNPCSSGFAGPYPNSEPEIRAFTEFYKSIASSVKMYLSFHAYGQYILIPYGHTFTLAPNYHDMMTIGLKGQEALRTRYDADYILGSIYNVMYTATGSSVDWAYGTENVPLAFVFELRDGRNGNYGFMLPADQIIENCEEFMDGLKAMVDEAVNLGYL